jgi:hypothetical protein
MANELPKYNPYKKRLGPSNLEAMVANIGNNITASREAAVESEIAREKAEKAVQREKEQKRKRKKRRDGWLERKNIYRI